MNCWNSAEVPLSLTGLEVAPAAPAAQPPRAAAPANRERSNHGGAVLGSIVEQFGKLRQQRAEDRQGQKKAR